MVDAARQTCQNSLAVGAWPWFRVRRLSNCQHFVNKIFSAEHQPCVRQEGAGTRSVASIRHPLDRTHQRKDADFNQTMSISSSPHEAIYREPPTSRFSRHRPPSKTTGRASFIGIVSGPGSLLARSRDLSERSTAALTPCDMSCGACMGFSNNEEARCSPLHGLLRPESAQIQACRCVLYMFHCRRGDRRILLVALLSLRVPPHHSSSTELSSQSCRA